jgi:hypothetical protein
MKKGKLHITVETLLYLAIFVIAVALRLSNLGSLPLTDSEAEYALSTASVSGQASQFWNEGEETIPLSSTYHVFTATLFYLFGTSDVNARIIPALAGFALVFSPLLLRKQLGSSVTLVLSFLFAISPVLVTTSRTAGGASLASMGLIFGISFLLRVEKSEHALSNVRWAGAALGLALASGPFVFHGLFSLVIGALALLLVRYRGEVKRFSSILGEYVSQFLWIALGVMVIIAVGFGFSFTSIASLSEAIGSWLSGWGGPVDIPGLTSWAMVLLYEPLVLIFGVIGAIVSLVKKDRLGLVAVSWMIGGLIGVLIYPARSGMDLTWVIVPLTFLAARTIVDLAGQIAQRKVWQEFLGLTCFLLVLFAFFYLQIAAYASGIGPAFDVMNRGLRLWLALGVLFLGGVVLAVFGVGWNWSIPRESLGLAGFLVLFLLNVSSLWRLNFAPTVASAQELWRPKVSTQSMRLMVETLEKMSQSYMRRPDTIEVNVHGEIPPSIAWAIRAFPKAGGREGLDEAAFPAVITSEEQEMPQLRAEYTGQSLDILERWGWEGILPPDPITWWIQRRAPLIDESWVLLIRTDIASLGETGSSGHEAP